MKSFSGITVCVFALVVLAGCASTQATGSQQDQRRRLARPDRIVVLNIAATPADIPAWSTEAGRPPAPSAPQSAEAIETGRKLGAEVAKKLVAKIREMGLPAVRAAGQPSPRLNDIVITGHFESIDEGSAVKRMAIGFGSGGAELVTQIAGYQMTNKGLLKLGSREIDSSGGKAPGAVVPLAVTIATKNPIGLIASSALKAGGEVSGRSTIEGSAQRTADKIAEELRTAFQKQGWL